MLLGVDLDSENHFQLLKSYFNAQYAVRNLDDIDIKLFKSSSGHGYHIEIHGIESDADMRASLCDDPYRIYESERRSRFGLSKLDDILFTKKRVFSGKWKRRVEIQEWQII